MMNEEVFRLLDQLTETIQLIKESLSDRKNHSQKQQLKQPKIHSAVSLAANKLGPTPDYSSDDWPIAVQESLMVTKDANEIKKKFRAIQMLGLMGLTSVKLRNVLDCGCGEGHTAYELSSNCTQVVGYDIKKSWNNQTSNNLLYTDSKEKVESFKPYDYIVLYDVIDHLEGEDPEQFLSWLASLLSSNGKIFMRCHPWTSIHGAHQYEYINKAYLHLALTPDELVRAGVMIPPNLKIVKPLVTYDNIITKAGLSIDRRKVQSDVVSEYFSGDLLTRIINVTWGGKIDADTALKIMSNSAIDYYLRKND